MLKKVLSLVLLSLLITSVYAFAVGEREFEFTYSFTVTDIPQDSKEVSVWAPIPCDTENQKIIDIKVNIDAEYVISTEDVYGNKIMSAKVPSAGKSEIPVTVSYKVSRKEFVGGKGATKSDEDMSKYLKASRLATISDRIRKISAEVTVGKATVHDKARAIYDYVFDKMNYDKSGEGWGRGDTEYACDVEKGNCTDFHSLFISIARAAGIPARFKIGFPLPSDKDSGSVGGYHCWAEYYDAENGWIPVDISEAKKNPSKKEYFFGAVCENRFEVTVGRDLTLNPKQSGYALNFFVYPYIEIDGAAHTGFKKDFSFKNL